MSSFNRKPFVMLLGATLFVLVSSLMLVPVSFAASVGINCSEDQYLHLKAQFDVGVVNEYRVTGTGPGLPTGAMQSSSSSAENFQWILDGPGSWSGLVLEWRRLPDVPSWAVSSFTGSLTYKCVDAASDEAGPPAMNLFDGRFNDHQGLDVAAPVAIYEGSIKVYGIDPESGDGWLSVDISEETIEAAGIPTDAPVLLGQGKNHYTGIDIFVYRLPSGEFQINTHYHDGKPYIFAWDADGGKWHFAA